MQFLLDSNILCRLARPDDPQYEAARQAVRALLEKGDELCLTPQVEREFWVVATRPRAQNGLGMTSAEADSNLNTLSGFCRLMADVPAVHEQRRRIVFDNQVQGKQAHDAGIVAAMQVHGITTILTFDVNDFVRYEHLIVVVAPE